MTGVATGVDGVGVVVDGVMAVTTPVAVPLPLPLATTRPAWTESGVALVPPPPPQAIREVLQRRVETTRRVMVLRGKVILKSHQECRVVLQALYFRPVE